MTATATTSTWKSPSHGHSQSRSSRPSTTPRAYTGSASVGQAMPPQTSPRNRSPQSTKNIRSPDAGYFGFVVNDESIPPDSNPGNHVKQNWAFAQSSAGSATPNPKQKSNETNPDLEAFRRQSEHNHRFNLSHNLATLRRPSQQDSPQNSGERSDDSPISPSSKRPTHSRTASVRREEVNPFNLGSAFVDIPRYESPGPMSPSQRNVAEHQHARLSLPASELKPTLDALNSKRSQTLPPKAQSDTPVMASAQEVASILAAQPDDVLVFDLRVYQQYAASRIKGALNLCLPTTLLKRPTFNVAKLAETFTSDHDRGEFEKWEDCECIVVYDASSVQAKEAIMPLNVLKKFSAEGWKGRGLVVKGGFLAFSKAVPQLIDHDSVQQGQGASTKPLSTGFPSEVAIPVAGGCSMPETKSAANPFFGNIRQNMDLLDGVGQMAIKKPEGMAKSDEERLPKWLRDASSASDEGKEVSNKFLEIERTEQKRMQKALSGEVSYGTPHPGRTKSIQVAGIEKGAKNRYNNIYPYEHTRVKLEGVPNHGCDYVNANYVQASYSNRKYIATQAPIPATFEDFWRVVWEQDVRVIVMLTAEAEGGQKKSDPYWNTGEYGHFKLKKLSERQVLLEKSKVKDKVPPQARPQLPPRRSTQPNTFGGRLAAENKMSSEPEAPAITVRHFSLSHSAQPFKTMREITQIHYTQWPDFGAPASPKALLGLIEQVNKYIRQSVTVAVRPEASASTNERPVIVHCSAGCGRTGTFCTIDSVIDMLKRQRMERTAHSDNDMDVDVPDDWVSRDDIDLVAKTVVDFRQQRLSMVQNLRQFVLCYESILQWLSAQQQHHQNDDPRARFAKEGSRRSYQGSLS